MHQRDRDLAIADAARILSDQVAHDLEFDFPDLLVEIVSQEFWREFTRPNGEVQRYGEREFVKFLTTPPTKGLGTTVEFVKKICAGRHDALDALDRVTARPKNWEGRSGDPPDLETPDHKTAQGSIRKLRKDAPELHARVLAGELSPNAAMIEAGFRRPRKSLYIDDPEDAARLLATWFSGPRLNDLLAALAEYIEAES